MFKRLILKLRKNRVVDQSTLKAVCTLLSASELSMLLSKVDDWRTVLERAAEIRKVTVLELGKRVAKKLKLQFVSEVAVLDMWLVPRKFSVESFREAGAVPIFEGGQLAALVCVDPSRLGEIGSTYCDVPRKLSNWSVIDAALSARSLEAKCKIVENRVSQLVSKVISEAKGYKAQSVMLDFSKKGIEYRFTTADQKPGVGSIGSGMKSAMLSSFAQALREDSGVLKVAEAKGQINVLISALSSAEYRLDWDKEKLGTSCIEQPEEARVSTNVVLPTVAPLFHARVIVIDDNETFILVLTRFFEKTGIRVDAFSDPSIALTKLKSGEFIPDAVICDLHMPAVSGLDLLRELRSMSSLKETPFVLLTSDDSPESEIRAISTGADAFISKSEEPLVLAAYVQKYLNQKLKRKAA